MAISENRGAYIPTSYVWDLSEIYQTDVSSEAFKELLVRLFQNMNQVQMAINTREAGLYDANEFVTGATFFADPSRTPGKQPIVRRQVYRKVVNFGALPNSTTKSVAHNLTITGGYTFTRLYGAASDTSNKRYIPVPNSSVYLEVDATNVKITTTSNLSNFTTTYVILEYIKQ